MSSVLKVVAWDDPRCVAPLMAAAAIWKEQTGDAIEIVRRPLTAFNDQPLSELSPICDVMIIDYPHIAQALAEGAIDPIEELISAKALSELAANAVGGTQESFVVAGQHAALASDAACHVSAYRPGAIERTGTSVPTTWDEVFELHASAPDTVAMALYHTDAISCLMSLTAGAGAGPDGGAHLFPDRQAAIDAVALLSRLAQIVDQRCWDSTPQAVFDWASEDDRIAYIPFTFGYSRRTRLVQGGWRFCGLPEGSGSLMGGAGMAVSSQSKRKDAAAAFASWYCGDEGQRLAARSDGQPAGIAAWDDAVADDLTFGFFSATRATQESAYIRPRAVWWPAVQTATGEALVDMLKQAAEPVAIVDALEGIYAQSRET